MSQQTDDTKFGGRLTKWANDLGASLPPDLCEVSIAIDEDARRLKVDLLRQIRDLVEARRLRRRRLGNEGKYDVVNADLFLADLAALFTAKEAADGDL